jgi:glycosyltransferase involved in cell wall biosynthesis
MTTIKAVITTLDDLPLLKEQIEILSGEPLIAEIIVVNNGSRDGTREWLETHSDKVIALHLEYRGDGPSRNAGLDRAGEFDYVLLLDGGIRPVAGSVEQMLAFLRDRPDIHVLGFDYLAMVTEIEKATPCWSEPVKESFRNMCLSETGYCLAKAAAFDGIRCCEEGPFAEPGWGVDDNELAYQWNAAEIVVHAVADSIHPFRPDSGRFQRIFEATGIWPNQYGSTYEKRLVWCQQNWPQFLPGIQRGEPWLTVVVRVADCATAIQTIKYAHDRLRSRRLPVPWHDFAVPYSIVAWCRGPQEHFLAWAEARHLCQHHGDTVVVGEQILRRSMETEPQWTGDFRLWHGASIEAALRPQSHYFGVVESAREFDDLLVAYCRMHPSNERPPSVARVRIPASYEAKLESQRVFSEIFETGAWGATETASGPGSTMEATAQIRPAIARLCEELNVRSILDIPCGSCHWMSQLDLDGVEYIGADIVPQLVDQCRGRYPERRFELLDLCHDQLPLTDLILSRDCLVHLSFDQIADAIRNFISSGAKWLLSTHFPGRSNYDIPTGAWRPLDLCAPPINLPTPHAIVNEGCLEWYGEFNDKSLGLWKLDDLTSHHRASSGTIPADRIAIGIITCNRAESGLRLACEQLRRAGFYEPIHIFCEPDSAVIPAERGLNVHVNNVRLGNVGNWVHCLRFLTEHTNAEFILVCEDDIAVSQNAKTLLESQLHHLPDEIGFWSLYTPSRDRDLFQGETGWVQLNRGWEAWGTQAMCFPRRAALRLIEFEALNAPAPFSGPTDAIVAKYFLDRGSPCFYHNPSLVEHVGAISTIGTAVFHRALDFEDHILPRSSDRIV